MLELKLKLRLRREGLRKRKLKEKLRKRKLKERLRKKRKLRKKKQTRMKGLTKLRFTEMMMGVTITRIQKVEMKFLVTKMEMN